jgi:hypothetical protein
MMNELMATIGTSTASPAASRRAIATERRARGPALTVGTSSPGPTLMSAMLTADPQPPTRTPSQRCWTKSWGIPVTFLLIAKMRGVV